ncbi:MAG: hypothetical protein GC154_07590 [bacterium]|nr:hypothetical protein [bacterium]
MNRTRITASSILALLIIAACASTWAEEVYINPDALDIDKIRDEEQLSDNVKLNRVYMFLAVLTGEGYETYAADGEKDNDGDGTKAIEEPNDVSEYTEVGSFDQVLNIANSIHICYISSLPQYNELFPNQQDPVEKEGGMVEVVTEESDDQGDSTRHLIGTKTLPIINEYGDHIGIERFIAFYNAGDDNKVKSYGFIGLHFEEEK